VILWFVRRRYTDYLMVGNINSSSMVDNEFALYSTKEIFDSINNSYKTVPVVDHYNPDIYYY